jgi:PAS domain-containing protein
MTKPNYDLHSLGSFQDLCIAVAEECLGRTVQEFLPSNDAGRDGAFVGRWEEAAGRGTSTIQCKFTSLPHKRLTLALLKDELKKAKRLVQRGLAQDYVILTNHPVSGASESEIKRAFEAVGVGNCRTFGQGWIVSQIQKSPRLRMVPRLYGLGDLGNILDGRAYEQAKMILSTMGDDLRKLVVTDAHRKSVKSITQHNFVLLLGAPAAGKSTIGAGLAVGAADIWDSLTIRATSPADVQAHLNPNEKQFFWVDDAWGSTQYQRHTIEAWNQVLPLMQAAIKRGTQFLLTSRDYIWKLAQRDLKTQALPLLDRSQVIINVQALEANERAQILYNHLKLGDQPKSFRTAIKSTLPWIAESRDFLPETARRLGSTFFTANLKPKKDAVIDFFQRPAEFLSDTIRNLDADCRAAIALVFLNGGRVASPVLDGEELVVAKEAFGVSSASVREALNALNGSLLLLAQNENGRYWTYKHPTVGDAFAQFVAGNPELVEVYLRGAKPEFIVNEVICAGVTLQGAPVCAPKHLYPLLVERIAKQESYYLVGFLSYRADREFAELLLASRPDLLDRLTSFENPIAEDMNASLLVRLHQFGLLSKSLRQNFYECVMQSITESADASFLFDNDIRCVFSDEEIETLLDYAEEHVLKRIPYHVNRLRRSWDKDYEPEEYFREFQMAVRTFVGAMKWR